MKKLRDKFRNRMGTTEELVNEVKDYPPQGIVKELGAEKYMKIQKVQRTNLGDSVPI